MCEGVDVLEGEQGDGEFAQELFEESSDVVGSHVVPAELATVEAVLYLLPYRLGQDRVGTDDTVTVGISDMVGINDTEDKCHSEEKCHSAINDTVE